MRLRLNLSLRRALMAAMAVATTLASSAWAGVADARYDLQYYLDFAYNKGMFTAGSTNIEVYFKDGQSVANNTITLMPNLDSYGMKGIDQGIFGFADRCGSGLFAAQFVSSAAHCNETNVYFLSENMSLAHGYTSSGYAEDAGQDWSVQRLNKLVTEVAYTPYATEDFMKSLKVGDLLYRLGHGNFYNTDGVNVDTKSNPMGGLTNVDSFVWTSDNHNGCWRIHAVLQNSESSPVLDIGVRKGDSGSPIYAWDDENDRFVQIAFANSASDTANFGSYANFNSNPSAMYEFMDSYTVDVSAFAAGDIQWGGQDPSTGKGTLTQGDISVEYVGQGSSNTIKDTLGLTFGAADSELRTLEIQGNVNMGAGALTFASGNWRLTENNADFTLSSAGFEVKQGASIIWELTGTASEEIRKVGEGTLTISGSGNNEATLVVGGGTTKYDVTRDAEGNIIGCTLGNIGETRLDRDGGYAASSVRLEAGVAIIVLMQDDQFKTNEGEAAGASFSFGNAGGLLNLNGHDLTWGVINQDGSGVGARIGNKTPLGEVAPGDSTFTYTGTGTFAGCFVDEGADSTAAQLAVVYNNADGGTWKLTGNNSNVGGYTVEKGTLVLEGYNTPHVNISDAHDWSYATLEGSEVTVNAGATFQLSHHALMSGDVIVEDGGSFVMNQAVNADAESIHGSLRQDMVGREITSLVGNVTLHGSTSMMTANVQSSAITVVKGDISVVDYDYSGSLTTSFVKTGNGVLYVDGNVNLPGGQIDNGGLVIGKTDKTGDWFQWQVGEKGFLVACGMDNQAALNWLTSSSSGVLALTHNQDSELLLLNRFTNGLYIGAWGDVHYGTTNQTLTAYNGKWLLGGGTGTLTVNFKLTGGHDLYIGNEWSSGTVHLANSDNDFTGTIYIQGTGNILTYAEGALGAAQVSLSYGNAMGLYEASFLQAITLGADGALALATSENLDLRDRAQSLGAAGEYTYTGTLTVDDTYRFGGVGHLTVDTALDGTKSMVIDGQGTTGSSVTLTSNAAFAGDIVAGGGLKLDEPNSKGSVDLHIGGSEVLASAESVTLQKGATLYTDGHDLVVRNLSVEDGALISHNAYENRQLILDVSDNVSTRIAEGALADTLNAETGDVFTLHLIKEGNGTLNLATNSSWSGGITINDGTVIAQLTGSNRDIKGGGIGASGASILVNEGGTVHFEMTPDSSNLQGAYLGRSLFSQTVTGTGTVVLDANGGAAASFSGQGAAFEGTVRLVDNTRLYLGNMKASSQISYNNLNALSKSTIEVTEGSQVRITNSLFYVQDNKITTTADFIIRGSGFAGSDSGYFNWVVEPLYLAGAKLNSGALSIDNQAVVYGNITLADDATIASNSSNPAAAGTTTGSNTNGRYNYGIINKLGGTIRGLILGQTGDETLTFGGNESMTITADSANTYGDLVIASGNGNNSDKFALMLDAGQAVSQTSTALGTGTVTLGAGLILRLAGTGVENNADVVYTYENAMKVGNGSTLQSYNITNVLTGTVTMQGESLNLATSKGGVLQLAGGVQGSGTLNVAADSRVILGSAAAGYGLTREGTPQFSGTVVAGAGADITLASPAVVAADTTFSGTDSLTLSFGGTEDYTLGGISVSGEDSALTLHFDFTQAGASDWTTLNSGISAGTTTIALDLNMFNEMASGEYTLISGNLGTGSYALDSSLGNRFSYRIEDGNFILVVGGDDRLYWSSAEGTTQTWEGSNWQAGGEGNLTQYSGTQDVMLSAGGLSTAGTREMISVSDAISVGQVSVSSLYGLEGAGSLTGTKLVVGNGGDLLLGVNATFSNGVQVAGEDSALAVDGSVLNATVQVSDGAALAVRNNATLTGNVTLTDASLQVTDAKISGRIILPGSLTGGAILGTMDGNGNITYTAGSLTATHSSESGAEMSLGAGTLTFDQAMQLDKLSLGSNTSAVLRNATYTDGLSKSIGTLEMGAGATLSLDNRNQGNTSDSAVIDELTLTGNSATIKEVHGAGHLKVGTLSMAEDVTSATLNLQKASMSATTPYTTIFEFGSATAEAGNFVGVVNLSQEYAHSGENGQKHSAFINLSGAETFANAVVQMNKQEGSKAYLGLGINAGGEGGSATIAGLVSKESLGDCAFVFSGYAPQDIGWNTGDGFDKNQGEVARTLIIDTDAGANHAFYGQVREMLSIVKQGEGTQAFYGASSVFNGSISVQEGTLAFNAASKGMLTTASGVTINGGTLDLSAIAFSEDATNAISLSETSSITFSEGASIAFGSMEADKVYSIFSVNGELTGWNTDVLSAEHVTINGTKLSEMYRSADSVSLTYGWDGSFSYSVVGADLTWLGGTNGNWDTSTSNWDITPDVAGDSTTFYQYDNVVFNNSAANKNVTLTEDITVGSMVIDGVAYMFGGAHALTVDTLTINGDVTTSIGNNGSAQAATVLTVNESSNVAGTLDLYWTNATLNLKGLNHEIGTVILRGGTGEASALNVNALSAHIGHIGVWNNSSVTFGVAEGKTTADYTVNHLKVYKNTNNTARTITVGEGVDLDVTTMEIEVGHSLVVNGALDINTLTHSAGAVTLSGSGVTTISGTANKTGGTLTVQGGELNFNGATTLNSLTRAGGTINFNAQEGAEHTTHTVTALDGGLGSGQLNVAEKVTLNVGSISHASTGGGGVMKVDGKMNVTGGVNLSYGWGESITGAGVLDITSNLNLTTWGATNIDIAELNVGGNLSLGSYYTEHKLNLTGGVMTVNGALSISQNGGSTIMNIAGGELKLNGESNLTAGQIKLNSGALTQTAGSTTIANTFTMSGGELKVTGGTLSIISTPTVSGGAVSISGGELVLGSAEAATSMLGGVSSLTLSGTGVLDLTALGTDSTISLANGAVFNFQASLEDEYDLVIKLGDLQEGKTYQLFDITNGGTLTGWDLDTLDLGNFCINGTMLNEMEGTLTLNLGEDGTFSFELIALGDDMLWTGGETGVWSEDETLLNWDNLLDETEDSVSFVNANSATFESSANVTLEGAVEASWMDVVEDAEVTLTAADGATLDVGSIGVYGTLNLNTAVTAEDVWVQGTLTADASNMVNLDNIDVSYGGTLNIDASSDTTLTANLNGLNVDGEEPELNGILNKTGNGTLTWDAADDTLSVGTLNISAGGLKTMDTLTVGTINATGSATLSGLYDAETVNVNGSGLKVNFTSANQANINDNATGSFTADVVDFASGTLQMSGTVNIGTLKIGAGLTAEVYNNGAGAGANKTFGTIELGQGSTLLTYDSAQPTVYTDINTVKLVGTSATIRDDWNSGNTRIANILGAADSTLELVKDAQSTAVGVYTLGSANTTEAGSKYAGTIALKQISYTGQRDVALILSHATVAQYATIDLNSRHSGASSKLGLGVNVASGATIGGLTSGSGLGADAIVFSGTQAANAVWDDKNTSTTKYGLTINTASGKTHDFYGQVQNVNLTISGTGTQNFLGASNSFSGSFSLTGGTAGFNAAGSSLLTRASGVTLGNGTVKAVESFSIANNADVVLSGTGTGTVFDTNGKTITVDSKLTGSGKLVKNGEGDLTFTKANTYSGATTINGGSIVLDLGAVTTGEGESAVTTNSVYTLAGSVSGEGSLEVATGTTLKNNSQTISADLVLDGGQATLTGDQKIQGDITVNTGATLTFDASVTASDTLNYDGSHKLTVNEGGVVDFATTRQTMGGWSIELNGGEIKGAGQGNWGAIDYHTALNGTDAHLIEAKKGDSVISADIRLRYLNNNSQKQDTQLKYDVDKNATLTMKGKVHSWEKTTSESTVAGYGSIIKEGEGKLIMTAVNTYGGTTSINEGTLELQGAGQIGKGNVSIASGAQLTAATTATADTESETWASISAAEGTTASLQGATITQTESSKTLSIAAKTAGTQGTMTNSLVQLAAGASLTVDNMLISDSSRIAGATAFAARESAVTSAALTNTTIALGAGNATVGQTEALTLTSMQVMNPSAVDGTLTLSGAYNVLTVNSDALSNLLIQSGSSFVVDFNSLLAGTGLADVDFVYLEFAATSFEAPANTTVSGLLSDEQLTAYYQTVQDVGVATPNVGVYFDVRYIPEPTTTTLSLLALAALAARRRRK